MSAYLECGPFSAIDGEGRRLFEDVSLDLEAGRCVALEGPSGSGKSTLLRQVTALAWTPGASRRLAGEAYEHTQLPAWRARVTLVAQDAPMVAGTVRDNLSLPFDQRAGRERPFPGDRASELLARVDLARLPLEREVRTLSGGERHRVALVRGLLWDPPVLVADEPLSALDPEASDSCFDLLLEYARRDGRLLLAVFHDPQRNRRADLQLRLADGRLGEV
jgi:putative ABC transport system ATP-binding protein